MKWIYNLQTADVLQFVTKTRLYRNHILPAAYKKHIPGIEYEEQTFSSWCIYTNCTHRMCIEWAARTQAPGLGWISADLLHLQGVYRICVPTWTLQPSDFVGCCRIWSHFVPLKPRSSRERSIPRSLQRWVLRKSSISHLSNLRFSNRYTWIYRERVLSHVYTGSDFVNFRYAPAARLHAYIRHAYR